jgi:HD-GYP domain-containing protein (c-di-GMP phosphodiesterase class II)
MALHDQGIRTSDPSDYRELPLSIMRINERYEFDIYLQIKADYRLFAAKGALFTEQHSHLLKSGYTKLYVRTTDWDKVEEYKSKYLSAILTDPKVSAHDKAEVAFETSMKSIRDVFKSVESRTIKHVEDNAEAMVKLILSEDQVMNDLIWINSHDHYTYQHSVRVGIYATALALKLLGPNLNKEEMKALSSGFFLHDIGMAEVPLKVLDKRAPLSPTEWGLVRMHPMWGYDRLLETGHLTPESAAIVLSHHERHNGSGYPFSREGDGIPIYAKICAIADIFESLTAVRPYRQAKEPFEALRTMQNEMAQDFDPDVFRAFIFLLGPKN